MLESKFQPGEVVQLRSGGPSLTVVGTVGTVKEENVTIYCVYYNPVSGEIRRIGLEECCLRGGSELPKAPELYPNRPREFTSSLI